MKKDESQLMEKIISLCKRRGFVFPGSEIYGGITGMWDFGPAGVLLRKNLKDLWWKDLVQMRDDMVGIDAAIIMNPKAWEASGHTASFLIHWLSARFAIYDLGTTRKMKLQLMKKPTRVKKWNGPSLSNLIYW